MYLSKLWRSLKMSLISSKVELKLKWTKYCVFSAASADNVNTDSIFSIKGTKSYFPVGTLSTKDNL